MSTPEAPFWAGGSPPGWFVKFRKEPDAVPGKATDTLVRWFDSRDHGNEAGAAHAAEALAQRLNDALGVYLTTSESDDHYAKELEWVAKRLRDGRAGVAEIDTLVNAIVLIRRQTAPTSVEGELVARYEAVKQIEKITTAEVAAHFWPLIKAATTEAEGRAILARVPGGCVEKAFFLDHMIYVSKVIPPVLVQ